MFRTLYYSKRFIAGDQNGSVKTPLLIAGPLCVGVVLKKEERIRVFFKNLLIYLTIDPSTRAKLGTGQASMVK